MELIKFIDKINSREDLVTFIKLLQQDYLLNDWENRDLESYLSAMEGIVDSLDGYWKNMKMEPELPSWRLFASILLTATIYE
jgi:hypothetical protein